MVGSKSTAQLSPWAQDASVSSDDGSVNLQEERSRRSTARLLEAAGELIVEGDFSSMTLAAIGERAGYSRGLASARFGSKDKLVEALVERIVSRWSHRNVLPQVGADQPGLDSVLALLEAITTQAGRDARGLRVLYALMFQALGPNPTLRERFREFHRGMRDDLIELVRRGIKDGSIRNSVSPRDEATFLVSALRGIGYQWLLDPDGFDPVPAFSHLSVLTRERLGSEAGRKRRPTPPARRRRSPK